MRKYLILTGKLLKTGLDGMEASGKRKKQKNGKIRTGKLGQSAVWLILLVCLLPLMGMIFRLGGSVYRMLEPLGQTGAAIEMIFFASAILDLVLAFPMVLSVFYMSNDLEQLLYLPLRPWQIVGAKFTVSLLYTCVSSLYLLAPFLLGYGIRAGAGILFWIFAVLSIFLVPVLSLVYSSIISLVLMRVFKKAKNKDFLSVLSVAVTLILAVGISMMSSSMGDLEGEAVIPLLMKGHDSLVGMMSGIFPQLTFLTKAMTGPSVLSFLIFLLITAAGVVVFGLIAGKLYFAGAMGMQETSAKRRKVTSAEAKTLSRKRSALSACTRQEVRELVRTPSYFMNCVLMAFLWPVIFIVVLAFQMVRNGESFGELLSMLDLGRGGASAIALFVLFCLSLMSGMFCYVAGTAISREGKNFYFMKVIPVPVRTQLKAKLLSAMIFSTAGSTGFSLILGIIFAAVFGLPVWMLPVLLAAGLAVNVIENCLQLFIDLLRPKLSWENEQQAVKQNMTLMLGMFLCMAVGVGLGFLIFKLYGACKLSLPVYSLIVTAVLAALAALIYRGVMAYGVRRVGQIEV